ncbi:MAG: carboxymuconolactone decarboxylase family protein [Halioglobus sp.]|nr:carboxymuconolactone decarboxylase family protein [Halioglobus sp.]
MSNAPRVDTGPAETGTGNVIRDSALGLVPEVVEALIALNAAVWDGGPLPPAEIELARLQNAQFTGCVMCRAVRYDVAVADGLTEDKVAVIQGDADEQTLSERERLIIAFTRQFHLDPAGIGRDLQQALRHSFTAAELLHLSMAVAYFCGASRCAVALGGMPESMPRTEIAIPR